MNPTARKLTALSLAAVMGDFFIFNFFLYQTSYT